MSTALYYSGPIGGKEFGTAIGLLVANKWVAWADCHYAYNRSLGRVDPRSKLYLLSHGHDQLPIFMAEPGDCRLKGRPTARCWRHA
jgi:hypothetical protein